MKMGFRNRVHAVLAAALLLAGATAARAIPTQITISGYLEDASGNPIEGVFATEIQFFETETSLLALDTVTTDTTVTLGVFAQVIEAPEAIISLDEVWYSLAIDTGGDGLDPTDLFADRFQITSVPFSISGLPADYFQTHSVGSAGSHSGISVPHEDLMLFAFKTPPGGVVFNKIAVHASNSLGVPSRCSFGIYDEEGALVVTTGALIVPPGGSLPPEVDVPEGRLLPSRTYYTALGRNQDIMSSGTRVGPFTRAFKTVPNVVDNGLIPGSFDPDAAGSGTDPAEMAQPVLVLLKE